MIQAAIFDMDGTLIDSEPMWQEAERRVFSSLGVTLSAELCEHTAAMTTREVSEFWYARFPWQGKDLQQVEDEVVDQVAQQISQRGAPMNGVLETLAFFQARGIRIGLATNAPARLIPIVLRKLGIAHYFQASCSSEHEAAGKPDPSVYLTAAQQLQVEPRACVAIEDSVSGILAANRANMMSIAIPPQSGFDDPKFAIADLTLKHMSDFNDGHLQSLVGRN